MVAESRPQPNPPKRSFIARFFIFLFKFILLIAVIAAGGALGALGATWINLSNVTDTAQDRRLDGLQQEVLNQGALVGQIPEMSIQTDGMATELDSLGGDTATLAADLASLAEQVAIQTTLLEAQDAQIAVLTEGQTGILDDLAAAQNDVENLVETTAGLRRNLATSSQSSTGLGDSLATLEAQVIALEMSLGEIQATVTSTETVAVVDSEPAETESDASATVSDAPVSSGIDLTLVQVLSQIARAKIHLLENDTDSAATAIDSALSLADTLTDVVVDGQVELLASLIESLEGAQANLDGKPAISAIELDLAWDSLDGLLTGLSN